MRNAEYRRKFRSYAARRYCWIQNEALVDRLERMATHKKIVTYYRQFELESEFRQAPLKLYASSYDLHANLQSAIAHKLQMVYIPGLVRDKVFKNYLEKYYENRIYLDFWRLTRRIKACFRGNAAVAKQVSLAELVKKEKNFKKNRLLKSGLLNEPQQKKSRKGGRSQNKSGKYKSGKNKTSKRGQKNSTKADVLDLNFDFLDRQMDSPLNITGLLNNMSRLISKSNIEIDVLQLPDPQMKLSFMNFPRRTPENAKGIGRLLSLGNTLVTSNNTYTGTGTSSRLNHQTTSNQRLSNTPHPRDNLRISERSNRSHSRRLSQTRKSQSRKHTQPNGLTKSKNAIKLSDCHAFEIKNENFFENYSTSPFSPTENMISRKQFEKTDPPFDQPANRNFANQNLNSTGTHQNSCRPASLLSSHKKNFQTPGIRKQSDQFVHSENVRTSISHKHKTNKPRTHYRKKRIKKPSFENQNIQNLTKSDSHRVTNTPQRSPENASQKRFSLSHAWLNLGKVISHQFPFEQKSLSAIKPKKLVLKTERPHKSPPLSTYAHNRSSQRKSSWRKVGFSKFKIHNFSQKFLGKGKVEEGPASASGAEKAPRLVKTQEAMSIETSQTYFDQRRKQAQDGKPSRKSSRHSGRYNNSQLVGIQTSRSQDRSARSQTRISSHPSQANIKRTRKMTIHYSKTHKENHSNSKQNLFCTEKDNRLFGDLKEKQPPILRKSTLSQMAASRALNRSPTSQRRWIGPEDPILLENSNLAQLMRSGQKEAPPTPLTPINHPQPLSLYKPHIPKSISRSKLSHNFISGMKTSAPNHQNSLHNNLHTKSQIRFPKASHENFLARLESHSNLQLGHHERRRAQESLSYRLSASICNTRFGESEKFGQMKLLTTFGNRGERLFPILMGGEPGLGYPERLGALDQILKYFPIFCSRNSGIPMISQFGALKESNIPRIWGFGTKSLVKILRILKIQLRQRNLGKLKTKFKISNHFTRIERFLTRKLPTQSVIFKSHSKSLQIPPHLALRREIGNLVSGLAPTCLKPPQISPLEATLRSNSSQAQHKKISKQNSQISIEYPNLLNNPKAQNTNSVHKSPQPKSTKFIPTAQYSKKKDDTVTTSEILGQEHPQNLTQQTEDWYMLSQHYKNLHRKRPFTQSQRDSLYSSAMNSLEVNKTRVTNTLCLTKLSKHRSQKNIQNPGQTFYLPNPLQKNAFQKSARRKTRSRASEIKSPDPNIPLSRTLIHRTFAVGTSSRGNLDPELKRPPFKPQRKKMTSNQRINALNFHINKKSLSEKFWNEKLTKRQGSWNRPAKPTSGLSESSKNRGKKTRSYRKASKASHQTNKTNKYVSSHSKQSNFCFESDNSIHPSTQLPSNANHRLQPDAMGFRSNFSTKVTNKNRNPCRHKHTEHQTPADFNQDTQHIPDPATRPRPRTEHDTALNGSKISQLSIPKDHLVQSTRHNWNKVMKNSESLNLANSLSQHNTARQVALFKSEEHNHRKQNHFSGFNTADPMKETPMPQFAGNLDCRQPPFLPRHKQTTADSKEEDTHQHHPHPDGTNGTVDRDTPAQLIMNPERHIRNTKKDTGKMNPKKSRKKKATLNDHSTSQFKSPNLKSKKRMKSKNWKVNRTAAPKTLRPLRYTHLNHLSQQKSFKNCTHTNFRKMKSFSPTNSFSANRLSKIKSKLLKNNRKTNPQIFRSKEINPHPGNSKLSKPDDNKALHKIPFCQRMRTRGDKVKAEWVWARKDHTEERTTSQTGHGYYQSQTEPSQFQSNSQSQSEQDIQSSNWGVETDHQPNRQFEIYLQNGHLPTTKRNPVFIKAISPAPSAYQPQSPQPQTRELKNVYKHHRPNPNFERNNTQGEPMGFFKNKNGALKLYKKSLPKISEGDVNDSFEATGTVSDEMKRTTTEKSREATHTEATHSIHRLPHSYTNIQIEPIPSSIPATPRTKRSTSKLGKQLIKQKKESKSSLGRPKIKLKNLHKISHARKHSPFSQRHPTPSHLKKKSRKNAKLRSNLTKIMSQRSGDPKSRIKLNTPNRLPPSPPTFILTPQIPKLEISKRHTPDHTFQPSSQMLSANGISLNSNNQLTTGKSAQLSVSNQRTKTSQNDTHFQIIGTTPCRDPKKPLDGSRITIEKETKSPNYCQNLNPQSKLHNPEVKKMKVLKKLRPLSRSPDFLRNRNRNLRLGLGLKFSQQRSLDRINLKINKKNKENSQFMMMAKKKTQIKSYGAKLRSNQISPPNIDSPGVHFKKNPKTSKGLPQKHKLSETLGQFRHRNELYNNPTSRLAIPAHHVRKAKSPQSKLHWKLSRGPQSKISYKIHQNQTHNPKPESTQRDWSKNYKKLRKKQNTGNKPAFLRKRKTKTEIPNTNHSFQNKVFKTDHTMSKPDRQSESSPSKRKLRALRVIQGRQQFVHARSFEKIRKISFKRK